jgi:hypothetical protein
MAINPFRKGGTDTIPVNEGGTGGVTASAALSNLGGLDTAAHALINHAGIPGAGGTPGIAVIESGATITDIQTALNNAANRIVYLKPGTYSSIGGNGGFTIPQGKKLIGLGGMDRNNAVQSSTSGTDVLLLNNTFNGSGTTARIIVSAGAMMSNIGIDCSGMSASSVMSAPCVDALSGAIVENCFVLNWDVNTSGASSSFRGSVSIFRNCVANSGICPGFTSTTVSAITRGTVFQNCAAVNNGGHGFTCGAGTSVESCWAFNNTGSGFRVTGSEARCINCTAENNDLGGFVFTSGGDGNGVFNCYAWLNTGYGFDLSGGVSTRPAAVGCGARSNTVGGFLFGAGWNNLANWTSA